MVGRASSAFLGAAALRAAVFSCAFAFAVNAEARRESGPSAGAVMINPLGIVYGPLVVEFDFGLGAQGSLNFRAARWGAVPGAPSGTSAWAAGVGAQIFASGPIYDGVFAYPALDMMWATVPGASAPAMPAMPGAEPASSDAKVTAFVPQLLFGYEFDWKFLALRLGIGGFAVVPRDPAGETAIGSETLGLLLDLSCGVTF
jgi:hypothetical protein